MESALVAGSSRVLQWEFSGGPNTVSSDTDGHTVHYVYEGSGPTLLFLHGNPNWSFVYRDVIRSLRDEFRCIAVDYPGFGLSSAAPGYRYLPEDHAQVIAAFVDTLALSGVTLVAHDWGGPIGLATVEQHPASFDRLVLANTWAWPIGAPTSRSSLT